MTWRLGGRPLERVLVSRLRYLGDVVMSTVVLEALQRGDPHLDVGYLCEEDYTAVLAGHSGLRRIHALATSRRGADARARRPEPSAVAAVGDASARRTLPLVRELRTSRYDAAVDLFFNPRSAWLLRLAGIPGRLAGPAGSRSRLYTHLNAGLPPSCSERWAALAPGGLGEHLARLAPLTHVESGRDFVDWFLAEDRPARTRLAPRPGAALSARGLLGSAGLDADPGFLVLAPAATWATKRWPVGHWRDLAARLTDAWPGAVVVLTAPGDGAQAAVMAAALPPGRGAVLPPLALPRVLDVLAAASGLITVDGGIMHAAVALGTPTLALFGPTDPGIWFPYEEAGPFTVLARRPGCHPCDRHDCDAFICLPELMPGEVAARALALFRPGPRQPAVRGDAPGRRAGA